MRVPIAHWGRAIRRPTALCSRCGVCSHRLSPERTAVCRPNRSIGAKTFYHCEKTFYLFTRVPLVASRAAVGNQLEMLFSARNLFLAVHSNRACTDGGPHAGSTVPTHQDRLRTLSFTTRRGSSTRSRERAPGFSILRIIMLMACSASLVTSCSIEVSAGSNSASAALLS